ncbi:unnamed protein product [Darwinula stevensoni]|uniref:STAS domain-containing protein n=1 Tax=Darwinula stevensoni TaxID=69355 RepID=A0A7R8X4U6_9CRUS|nr:unnamed protein product [Darwinula stevensoni]CAG0886428.1 unnamed protein product [Darwinula stevensoni]
MHIPQGMAYAMLANIPPVYGIYMAFFPVLTYVIMGTSRHASMGSFAVVCLMTGKVVGLYQHKLDELDPEYLKLNATSSAMDDVNVHHAVQIAAAVGLTVGFFQILMGIVQMGNLTVFLSDTLTYIDFFPMIMRSNAAALIVAGITMFALALNNDLLKPCLAKKCPFPVPIELICVVIGTAASYGVDLHHNYNITTVGYLPTGLPSPEVPPLWLMGEVDFMIQCLVIAIVGYATSISMAKLLARKAGYRVDPNQDLLAQGVGNAFGAMFGCPPFAASLSRSLIQHNVGGKTQVANVVSCALLLIILLFLAPLFTTLPKAVLAGIILVSLKGMFYQVADLKKAWRVSKLDAFVWVMTFLSVILIDIDYGLAIGVASSLLTLIWRNQRAYACILGQISDTGIYVDVRRFDLAKEEEGIKILHYGAGIHFGNREAFKQQLFKLTQLEPQKWEKRIVKHHKDVAKRRKNRRKLQIKASVFLLSLSLTTLNLTLSLGKTNMGGELVLETNGGSEPSITMAIDEEEPRLPFWHLIFDLTGVSFVDASGISTLTRLVIEYHNIGVRTYFAGAMEDNVFSLDVSREN